MSRSSPNLLLTYRFSTAPAPLQVSTEQTVTTGRINVAVFSGAKPVYCNQILVAVPIGDTATDFSVSTPSAAVNTAKWTMSSAKIQSGADLGLNDKATYATFTFQTRDSSDNEINYDLVFGLSGPVNAQPGSFPYLVQEQSGTTNDPSSFTAKKGAFPLRKVLPQFYAENFIATATAAPTTPVTEFANGADIRFSWESNGTYFQIFEKANPVPIYAGTATEFILVGGVANATTFVLVASVSGDPGGAGAGSFEPIYLYQSLSITISNPALTPSSSAVAGNATVGGTLAVTGASTLHDTTADGTLAATGNATVGGNLGVTGQGSLGSATVAGTLDVAGSATLAGAAVHGLLSATGVVGMVGTPAAKPAGTYTATTDGFVVGFIRGPSGSAAHESWGWITGSTGGMTVMAAGGNVCAYFHANHSKLSWAMATDAGNFVMPVKGGSQWSVGFRLGGGVVPPYAFYWIPLGSDTAASVERIGDATPPAMGLTVVRGGSDVDDSNQHNVDQLMAVLIDLFGESMTVEKRQRLRAAIKALVFQEIHKAGPVT